MTILDQIAKIKPLTKKQEQEIAVRWWEYGDKLAFDRLISSCYPYVLKIAHKYVRPHDDINDLFQAGIVGLLEAAERFDPTRGYRLLTYAAPWINGEIRAHQMQHTSMVAYPMTSDSKRAFFQARSKVHSGECAHDAAERLHVELRITRTKLLAILERNSDRRPDSSTWWPFALNEYKMADPESIGVRDQWGWYRYEAPTQEEQLIAAQQRRAAFVVLRSVYDQLQDDVRDVVSEWMRAEDGRRLPLAIQRELEALGAQLIDEWGLDVGSIL